MAIDNLLRISVRIDLTVGDMPVAMADLALPAASSLAEVLDEILQLTGAPEISRPWVGRTAAGSPIEAGIPLHRTQLEQGGVLVLSPERDLPAPIIRDAAEALVELSSTTRAQGLVELVTATGFLSLAIIALSPLFSTLDLRWRILLLIGTSVLVLIWLPRPNNKLTRTYLPCAIVGLSAMCAALSVSPLKISLGELALNPLESRELALNPLESRELALVLVCASVAALISTLILHICFQPALLSTATLITMSITVLVTAGAAALWNREVSTNFSGPASITVAASMILISFAPNLAAHFAGLRVPRLPTAGQDLSISDTSISDPTVRARRATKLFDAQLLGLCLICTPLILLSAFPGTWFSTFFCISIALCSLIHALRHRAPIPTWSLMVLSCAAMIASVISALNHHTAWPGLVLSGLITITFLSVAIWIPKIPQLEPTSMVWVERLESLCLAAALPLGLHLLGFFDLLRGLDIGFGG